MGRYNLIIIVLLLVSSLRGQEITLSHEISFSSTSDFNIIGEINDTILLFKQKNYNYGIEIFNKKLEYLFYKELFFEKQKIHFNGFFEGKNDFTIIYSYESRFTHYVNAVKYDLRGNVIDSTLLYEKREYLDDDQFIPVLSDDKSKLLLLREAKFNSLDFILFDLDSHKLLWEKQLMFNDYRMKNDLYAILVNNSGELYLAFEKYNYTFRRKKHFQEIYFIDPFKDEIQNFKVDFQGKLSVSFNFVYDEKNDELITAGLFAPRSSYKAEGYYLYKIRKQGISQAVEFFPFSRELLIDHSGGKRKLKKSIQDLTVNELIARNDGGVLMITEMQREISRESARRRYIDYHYEDMVLLALHPDGTLFWDDLVRKYQLSFDDAARFSSFFLFKTPSRVRIVFNDEIKSQNTISEYLVDPLGNGVRKSLFSTDLHKLKLVFEEARQSSSDSFLVPSIYNNKYRIVKLVY